MTTKLCGLDCAGHLCVFRFSGSFTREEKIIYIGAVRFSQCQVSAETVYYSIFSQEERTPWTGGRVKHEIDEVF